MAEIRALDGVAEQRAASALYREVFGYTEPEWGLSPRLLAALRENAGTAIGAFDPAGTLIGFCYGFTAVEAGEIYHYSQATVVTASAQGTGVGRGLKHAQAAAARHTGASTMRWAFDPYALRNAHFNLAVLGATGIGFRPDLYGEPDTDRVVVSWDLSGARVARTRKVVSVVAPAGDRTAAPDPDDRRRLRQQLIDQFAAGRRLAGVARTPAGGNEVAYTFDNGAP